MSCTEIFVTPCGLYDTAYKDISQKQVYTGQFRGQMSQIAGKYESVFIGLHTVETTA